jgi:hypothetical protein
VVHATLARREYWPLANAWHNLPPGVDAGVIGSEQLIPQPPNPPGQAAGGGGAAEFGADPRGDVRSDQGSCDAAEHLLESRLLMAVYATQNERQFCERSRYDCSLKWFWTSA